MLGLSANVYAGNTSGEECVTIKITVTDGSNFYKSKSNDVMILKELTVPYFDLALYGLEHYYYNPDCYKGEQQTAGTSRTAEGKVTVLHALIYATEVFELNIPEDEAGLGILYLSEEMSDYLSINGKVGSIFFTNFWQLGYNMNYFINYSYPLGSTGWGATADQILLEENDHINIHHIKSNDPNITGTSYAYFAADGIKDFASVKQGEILNLDLLYTTKGSNNATVSVAGKRMPVYYTTDPSNVDPSTWTYLGHTDVSGRINFDTSLLATGTYYIATSSVGASFDSGVEYAPGAAVVTIEGNSCGDVNGDGKINSTDASMILRYAAGKTTILDPIAADVSGDQKINSTDASLILRYAAGLIMEFPAN